MNIYSEWRSLPRHFLCTALTLSGAALLAVPAPGYGRTKPGSELNILYSFCAKAECKDGKEPSTSLSFDSAGNLYGTTLTGGPRDSGVIFQISPDGKMHLLYTFCRKGDCFDGQGPA